MFTLNIVAHLIADLLDDKTCAALAGTGIEALLAALTAAGATAAVTGPCLAAIVKLCCSGAELAAELATDGACDAVMACARSCDGDPTVHACAWGAVASLCRDAGNVARLGARGACEALGAVLRDHATFQQIQLAGVAAARQLATHDGNAARLAAAGCCEAVVAAMNLYHGDADMQQMALSAIAMLAGSQHRAALFGVPGCWAVLSAVRAFPLDDVIQQRGKRAMLALCSLDSNNRWLERSALSRCLRARSTAQRCLASPAAGRCCWPCAHFPWMTVYSSAVTGRCSPFAAWTPITAGWSAQRYRDACGLAAPRSAVWRPRLLGGAVGRARISPR
eukprot:TRINITY_DN1096_c0_g1_i1.p1 TRINITY_DN1096_c0_g1~~TRINITY_DN1096_c0_g1_i1.p1  ORF type:complete len:335 (+),score=49.39 TRINITY_DN1096_c0_g1_i1:540-1544(+)